MELDTLHVAFSPVRGCACILIKRKDGLRLDWHVERLRVDPPAYAWRTLWLAVLMVAQRGANAVVFYTDREEVVDTLNRYRESVVHESRKGGYWRAYSEVVGLKKDHPAYIYIRSIVPVLNEFWPGRWKVVKLAPEQMQETKALAPKDGWLCR